MYDEEFWWFLFLTYILMNLTEEKMEEIEKSIEFKLWLKRVGFHTVAEYNELVQEWYINRKETILYYLRLKDEKDNEWNVLDDIVKNLC